jgi:hypothetical protein
MALIEEAIISCGVDQLYNLMGAPKEIIKDVVATYAEGYTCSILLFSDNEAKGNGKRLAKFIRDNKLGRLIESRLVPNRNMSGTTKIRCWMWHLPPLAKLKKACGWTREDTREIHDNGNTYWSY